MRFKEDSLKMIMWSKHSRRSEPSHGRRRLTTDATNFNDYSGNGVFGRDSSRKFVEILPGMKNLEARFEVHLANTVAIKNTTGSSIAGTKRMHSI